MDLLVIRIFDVIFAETFHGCPSRPLGMESSMNLLVIWISNVIFAEIFCGCPSINTLAMESVGPDRKTSPFSWSNDHRSIHGSFGDPNFQRHFCRNLSWKFEKTIALEPVGLDGKIGPFSSSNDPRRRFFTSFLLKFFLEVCQDLRYRAGLPQ
ncbi:hypothetical protein H5410_056457 [Solanum commersonii]|uniref:Uncharacterized protein n=1 Tax=Solanum commersonii TaxID=4109 RepID=A0A9J5WKB9_SOLCO|nr:hypothetical protein H5410_056457 [Solanum commersonii]